MVIVLKAHMASKQGRPKAGSEPGDTRLVRMHGDLADMIGWIVRLKGGSAASLLDPMVRPQITALYKVLEPAIKKIKEAEEQVKQLEKAAAAKHSRQSGGEKQ